ncbi:alpha/beta hydrolase [Agrobacterium pusense]|uniref:alpha/beta hydrolase n=1 Tax=Agrobacterium pusense TaxID=648995 RepID=UPI0032DAA8DC
MIYYSVDDWTDAYSNTIHIAGGDGWPARWTALAAAYRASADANGRARLGLAYGDGERERFDLFLPAGEPEGLVVFVHGGYWSELDNSYWSHLAAGSIDSGYAVAIPGYSLCPAVRIAEITAQVAAAITHAAGMIAGPVHLAGHSAGGHLVTRMLAEQSPLGEAVARRIANTVSISGVHDLRPLMRTEVNDALHLDAREAAEESPVLSVPRAGTRLLCWVGASERAEFRRQNALLANIWAGLGAETASYEEPDRHHFDVLDGLISPRHPLTRALLGN